MIVLDTNVISELFKPVPDAGMLVWMSRQPEMTLFTTTITRGELLYGVRRMPDGQRKDALMLGLSRLFDLRLLGRVLDYDGEAADAYADIAVMRRSEGRPISQSDAMIAGVVRSRGADLATRNVSDFAGCGITVINPWE
jgi:toxin FitB